MFLEETARGTTLEYFRYLGSMTTNNVRCTREIKSRISIAKAALKKKKTLFTSKLDLNLRKKLVKYYIWSTVLYGAETWTLREVDEKYLERFKMWRRKMTDIICTDREKNAEVLKSQGEKKYPKYNEKNKG